MTFNVLIIRILAFLLVFLACEDEQHEPAILKAKAEARIEDIDLTNFLSDGSNDQNALVGEQVILAVENRIGVENASLLLDPVV